ncbi:MAG TPA: RNA polymerase sigma factor [Jatrophihabitantaceae bacterium]|jgi:RNA polymerase sigma-70 factor (ECF subfamily)
MRVPGGSRHAPSDAEQRFRPLFESHARELLGYALRRVGSPEDAADVVADTMLVAWRRIGDVPTDGTARLWLYGVARRVLANHHRSNARRERLGERLRQQLRTVVPDPADDVTSVVVIRQALAALSGSDRELIELTTWEGLEPHEVAVVLGVPARTVRNRLHRARTRLRRQLGDARDGAGHVWDVRPAHVSQEEQ